MVSVPFRLARRRTPRYGASRPGDRGATDTNLTMMSCMTCSQLAMEGSAMRLRPRKADNVKRFDR